MTRRIAIRIDHRDAATVAEAWRAAVGVSLRGDRVTVATVPGAADGGPAAVRARATLALFGHDVDGDPDAPLDADVIELWRDGRSPAAPARPPATGSGRVVVHLVRAGRAAGAVADRDRVLQLGAPADVDHAAVLDALAAADTVCVW